MLLLSGLWMLAVALLTGWGKFGWVYWQSFLTNQIVPSLMVAAGGILLWLLARPLGNWLGRGLED